MTSFPDPRQRIRDVGGAPRLDGWRCTQCRRPFALSGPWCPYCRGRLEPALFGLSGVVWSATVLRVPLPGRPPPSALVYVDLDDGPRVLGHVRDRVTDRLHAGARVRGTGLSEYGDLAFEEEPS